MTALRDELIALIQSEGPINIARYMELALGHPVHGYYMTRDPFGATGDFTTAPEISQMFGELIGLWIAQVWLDGGALEPVALVEAGPGRGTLMADAWRALASVPGFHAAATIHLIETSPVLRAAQAQVLDARCPPLVWHAGAGTLPSDRPIYLIANEFLDALPIRQYVRRGNDWRERLVGLVEDRLAFGLAPEPEPALRHDAPDGSLMEIAPAVLTFVSAIAARIRDQGGAAVFIDYGSVDTRSGDTLQAIQSHGFVDPLENPGEADLTAHVDFAAVAAAARQAGAQVHGPVTQRFFLHSLGLDARAESLSRGKNPAKVSDVASARDRLIDARPTGMGALFKVLALTHPGAPPPPGFA